LGGRENGRLVPRYRSGARWTRRARGRGKNRPLRRALLYRTRDFFIFCAASLPETRTHEASGAYRHCFDHHGYKSSEERSGDYTHGWDNDGHAWTEWRLDDRTYTWPTR
jgi:hypothetical protein